MLSWRTVLILALGCIIIGCAGKDASEELVDSINPMIGAITLGGYGGHGLGKTFPGAATPFGMVQLSPDTITGGDNGSGYSAHHETIEGFSFTHLSGTGWYGDLGNFQVMASTGDRQLDREQVQSAYDHEHEMASAGYYMVDLHRYGIRAELTTAPRAGMIRFTFPASDSSRIQIDLGRRIGQNERWLEHSRQFVKVVDEHTIEGYLYCSNLDGGFGHGHGNVTYTIYYTAQFSIPLETFGVWDRDQVFEGPREYEGENVGFFVEFPTETDQQVLIKTGISFVSQEGARANLAHDIPGWDFDVLHKKAYALWADALDGIECWGGTVEDREILATALYHCMIDPRSVSDVDGQYRGADNQVHRTDEFVYRTIFSGWDVFRSQFPLLTLIRPDVVNDEINSFLQMANLSGRDYLPRWEMMNSYTDCMLGNPAVSVIVDAYQKGIRKYDIEEAYRLCRNTVNTFGNDPEGYTPGDMSRTLEYAYSDWCMGRFTESLHNEVSAEEYYHRSLNYKNIWDPRVQWMRPREAEDTWAPWTSKLDHGLATESNAYQQGWFVPHDVAGLVDLMGEDFFIRELEAFFDNTPEDFLWNDYYNHPNEPCHHVPFLFNYVGCPWLTQKWTRMICQKAYGTGVRGLCGNEDIGQMSAWYVLAAMGIHPVCPGDNVYQITSPVFQKVRIRLDPDYYRGRTFTVIAKNNSADNIYIQSAKLNGTALDRAWITHDEIAVGGTLELEMGPSPNKNWASAPEKRPPSLSTSNKLTH